MNIKSTGGMGEQVSFRCPDELKLALSKMCVIWKCEMSAAIRKAIELGIWADGHMEELDGETLRYAKATHDLTASALASVLVLMVIPALKNNREIGVVIESEKKKLVAKVAS